MRKILALLLSVMLICSSVGLGFAEGDLLIEEEDLAVDGLDGENGEDVLEEVLMEAETIEDTENEDEQEQETEEIVLFVDESVVFDDAEAASEDVSEQETAEKLYLSMEAGKALFADADLTEVQVVLAEDAVVLGQFQETVYAVEYADAEGVKTAYASAYDVAVMDEEAVSAYTSSAVDAVEVEGFVLMPVAAAVETAEEAAAEEEVLVSAEENAEEVQTEETAETEETDETEETAEAAEEAQAEEPAEEAEDTQADAEAEEAAEPAAEAAEGQEAEEEASGDAEAEPAADEETVETVVAEEETVVASEDSTDEAEAVLLDTTEAETAETENEEAELAVEEVQAEMTAEEAEAVIVETAEETIVETSEETEEDLTVSDEVIENEASLGSSVDDFMYEDPSTKTIISGYKVDAPGGAITIPAAVKTIRNGSFDGNKKITSVSFAGSKCDVETGVFQNCTSLISCALPELNNPTNSVPDGLFRGCTSLKSVSIQGNNTKVVGDNAFFGCSSLTSVSLGTQIETVGASAFEGCSSLVSISLGDNVKTIGSAAFRSCTEFVAYSMGNKVEKIGEAAFMGDVKLQSMTWSSALKYIEAKAFQGCVLLGSVSVPATVETIGASAFEGCIGLTDLRFEGPSTTKLSIFTYAFRGCTGLKDVDLPDRLENIWQGAFMNCTNVVTVSIPKTVKVIGEEAFRNDTAMTTLTFRDRNYYDGSNTLIIYSYAFQGCTSLKSAMLPARTSRVEKQAFYGDKSIVEVEILGNNLVYIGSDAFAGLAENVWMTIWKKAPNGSVAIGGNAFGTTGDVCSYLGYDVWKYCKNTKAPHWVPLDAYLHVQDCYNIILGRNWTAAEIAAYRQRFHNDAVTGVNIVEGLLRSSEFKVPADKEWKAFLTEIVYKTMVLRDPDATGKANYMAMLSKGASVYYQLAQIVQSTECNCKMALIGLKPGTIKLSENRDQNIDITYFVTRLYKEALGRRPDLGGLNNWTGILLTKQGNAYTVSVGFLKSKEFANMKAKWKSEGKDVEEEVVKTYYRVYLGREALGGEEAGWVTYLKHGMSETFVMRGFVHSPEFTKIAADAGIPRGEVTLTEARDQNYSITYFVWRCYKFGLGREPEAAGINDWCAQIINKKRTYDGVARGVLLSKEMENRGLSNENWLEAVYKVYFDRASDAVGKADWLGKMAGGATKTKVLDGFSGSKEFANLLEKLGLPK